MTTHNARILLIEDDDVLSSVVMRNLTARGHEVRVATDVQEALTYIRSEEFDLIFLDINLPDQTGWDVLRVAQSEGRFRFHIAGKLPVVVLSAVRVSPHRLAEFHPLAYLPKPFPMEALLRLAAEATQRCANPAQASQQENDIQKGEEIRYRKHYEFSLLRTIKVGRVTSLPRGVARPLSPTR